MNHIVSYNLFESQEKNPFDVLAGILQKTDISDEIESEIKKDEELVTDLESNNEGISLVLGAILSLGKLSSLVGSGFAYLGKKLNADEESSIIKISDWLKTKGDKYTHSIESIILKIAERTPVLKTFMNTLDDKQKSAFSKAILTMTLLILGGKGVMDIVHSIENGHGVLTAIESVLVGTKATEIAENIPQIIKAVAATSVA